MAGPNFEIGITMQAQNLRHRIIAYSKSLNVGAASLACL